MPSDHAFEPPGGADGDLIGPPDAISSALGFVVLAFGALDACVSAALGHLLDQDGGWGQLLAAALPFEEKLALLDARVRLLAPTWDATPGAKDPVARFGELRAEGVCVARMYAEVVHPALAEDTLARIARLLRPASRRLANWRRHTAREEAGVLFELVLSLRTLTEELRAFFAEAGPHTR